MEEQVEIYYLLKGKFLDLQFSDRVVRHFTPSASVPVSYVDNLLTKQVTIGGCCGKPQRTVNLFATKEQLDSGERTWIE